MTPKNLPRVERQNQALPMAVRAALALMKVPSNAASPLLRVGERCFASPITAM